MREPRDADVRVLTEDEMGQWRREQGRRVIRHRGRLWLSSRGFCRLLHHSATIPAHLASRPSRTCWAFHAPLDETESELANAASPIHLLKDLASFDEGSLASTERKRLRRAREALRLVRIDEPELLQSQGWEIFSQNARRLDLYQDITEEQYRGGVSALVSDPRTLVLGAMDGDRLLGYQEAFAVEGTAYLSAIRLNDEGLSRHASGFLVFETAQLYRRSLRVSRVCAGLPLPQRPGVTDFKRRWGMPLVDMPARFWAPPPARALLRAVRPDSLYWATGTLPRTSATPTR